MGVQQLVEREIASLRPYSRNARTHSKKQLKQIAASIERFGFTNGRPKCSKNKPKPLDPAHQPTDNFVLEEAYRPVSIREGDKVIELPAIQAAVRSLAIAAMKGSRLSQRALAELVRQVEDRKASEHLMMMENAFEYKQKWTAELERRRRLGIDEPDPIPHPDDIIIDMRILRDSRHRNAAPEKKGAESSHSGNRLVSGGPLTP